MPPFAILYDEHPSGLTPRQAFYLWSGLQLELDDFLGAADGEETMTRDHVDCAPANREDLRDDRVSAANLAARIT